MVKELVKLFFSFILGAIAATALLYFVCISSLNNTHADDVKYARELKAESDKYKLDYNTTKDALDAVNKSLEVANSRIAKLIGSITDATGSSTTITEGLAGDYEIARQIELGLSNLTK